MSLLKKNLLGLAIAVMVEFSFLPIGFAQKLQITAPHNGAIINPGQTVTVSVSAATKAGGITVLPSSGFLEVTPSQTANAFALTVPASTPLGIYSLTAVAQDGEISHITFHVEQAAAPSSIEISSPAIQFDNIGDRRSLEVFALFPDGERLDVTQSTKIKYKAASTHVAKVSAQGVVTSVGAGGTTITATYGGVSSSIPVMSPLGDAKPVYKFKGAADGVVSKDGDGNYVVNVDITNTGNVTLALLTLTSATLNKTDATSLPGAFTVFDPGTSKTAQLIFPSTAGTPGSKATVQIKGTYEGPLRAGGKLGDQGPVNVSVKVHLPRN